MYVDALKRSSAKDFLTLKTDKAKIPRTEIIIYSKITGRNI